MTIPDRISGLIERLERGEEITDHDVRRIAVLQSLDLAKIGEDFARDAIQREREYTERYRQSLENRA